MFFLKRMLVSVRFTTLQTAFKKQVNGQKLKMH